MFSNEGYKLYGQGDAPNATKGLELKAGDVQSEGSQSATGLEDSTRSVTGLLYDYMDGDTGEMSHTCSPTSLLSFDLYDNDM